MSPETTHLLNTLFSTRAQGKRPTSISWFYLIWDISEINISDIKYLPKCFSFIRQPRPTQHYKTRDSFSFAQTTVLQHPWFKTEGVCVERRWMPPLQPFGYRIILTAVVPAPQSNCFTPFWIAPSLFSGVPVKETAGQCRRNTKKLRPSSAAITSSSSNMTGSALRRRINMTASKIKPFKNIFSSLWR